MKVLLDTAAFWWLASLPTIHRDPFDRILICQALDEGMTLLTPDQHMREYPVATIWD